MRESRPTDQVIKMACSRHGVRWVLWSLAAQWSCSSRVGYGEDGAPILCGKRGKVVGEATVAELVPPRVIVAHPRLDDFCRLIVDLADAGIEVDAREGHLVLRHRRAEPIASDLAERARQHRLGLMWAYVAAGTGNSWHVCTECNTPQLVARKRQCKMTPGCPGELRPLPRVVARRRRPKKGQTE